jgi:2-oxoglutarate ferredoxin oxidoreductase subunit beta
VQRLCRDENLAPEQTMFVSGIGCSSRLPHYMKTYGFHGIHGRAFPVAEGIKMARPDLKVFVNTGDGDCCSIGAGHWIHAIRYNMDMVVMLHDNHVYGLTKKQASPTSPIGFKSNTTPRGSYLEALNPLTVTLGVQNVSFVAPGGRLGAGGALRHRERRVSPQGLLLHPHPAALPRVHAEGVRRLARGPREDADPHAPGRPDTLGRDGAHLQEPARARSGRHRPSREIASCEDPIPVGILYRNPEVPVYEEVRHAGAMRTTAQIRAGLNAELDRFGVWPRG